jgi:rhodanese-related sulfurtransferase
MHRKPVEITIIILFLVFWFTLITLAVTNQFNVASVPSEEFEIFLQEQNPILIDLRESVELARDSLNYQPLLHLPFQFVENHLDQIIIPQDIPVLYVCSDGNRARLIAALLQKRGYLSYYLRSGLNYIRKQEAQGSRNKDQGTRTKDKG